MSISWPTWRMVRKPRMSSAVVTGLGRAWRLAFWQQCRTLHYDHTSGKSWAKRSTAREIAIAPEKEGRWRVEDEFVGAIRGQETIRFTDFATGVQYMEFHPCPAVP